MTENKRQPQIQIDSLSAGPASTIWGKRKFSAPAPIRGQGDAELYEYVTT